MARPLKPIFLLADSQLLFWQTNDRLFLHRAREMIAAERPMAAYVGASNGDNPVFFDVFRGAMRGIGITDCRMIPSDPSEADLAYCDAADLILLAGGEVQRGWDVMRSNGLSHKIVKLYWQGAVLIGVSAGAVQLGLWGGCQHPNGAFELVETCKLVPALIDVHQGPQWSRLHQGVAQLGEYIPGLGIATGGGVIVHPDRTLEPVRRALVELRLCQGELHQSFFLPPGREEGAGAKSPRLDAAARARHPPACCRLFGRRRELTVDGLRRDGFGRRYTAHHA